MSALQYIGNGDGYIYITKNVATPTDQDIITTVNNDCQSLRDIVYPEALASASLYANKSATSTVSVTAVAGVGNITAVTINGVNQIASNISVSGLSEAQVATAISDAINGYTPSGPDYKAVAIGETVSILAEQASGSDVNGLTVTVSNDDPGNIDVSATDLSGGANSNDLIDEGCGRKFLINPDFDTDGCAGKGSANEGDLTNAVEISEDIIFQGLQGSIKDETITASSGQVVPNRVSAIQNLFIAAEVGFIDDIETISTEGFSDNDVLYTRVDKDSTITYKSTGNITLEGGNDFIATDTDVLVLVKSGSNWLEVSRSEARLGDTADYRAAGFAFPIEGSTTSALPTAGGFNIETNSSTVIQRYTGNVTLTGNLSITFAPTGNDGDEVWVFMDGTVDKNGNSFTVNGEQLSDKEALTGGWVCRAKFNGVTWDSFITYRLGENTTWKLDVNARIENEAIQLSKLDSSIKTELITIPVSLEANELGEVKFVIPYKCTVTSITAYVTKLIEATEDASILPKNDASLVMTDGTLTMIAGSSIGTGLTVTPTANNVFTAGDTMTLEGIKTTPGGKVLASVTVVRS
jgi:hypothetical protein